MGLLLPQIIYTTKMCLDNNITGSLVSLGRLDFFITLEQFETIMLDLNGPTPTATNDSNKYFNNHKIMKFPMISDKFFYTTLGFTTIDCIDWNKTKGDPSIVFDMNQNNITRIVNNKYDLVIDAGVMEHVFDVRAVFLNMTDLVKDNGFIIHIMPSNNTMDHGFYQFSPTLFRDYYLANNYRIVSIKLLEIHKDKYAEVGTPFIDKWSSFKMWDYDPYIAGKNSFGQLSDSIYYTMTCVQKTPESLRDKAPIQYMFQPNAKIMSPWE